MTYICKCLLSNCNNVHDLGQISNSNRDIYGNGFTQYGIYQRHTLQLETQYLYLLIYLSLYIFHQKA